MIRTLSNAPCIGLWGLFNEGWGQFDALRLTELIRKEDPGRLVDHASGWFDQGGGDMKSVHNYFRALRVEKESRPFFLSEHGGFTCRVPGHDMYDASYGYHDYSREELPEAISKRMEEIALLKEDGLAGDVFTQLSDIEEEINGLLTYDRRICKTNMQGR